MRYVMGIDYGTRSARAVVVTEEGQVLGSHTVEYPHGVMEGALASAQDYEDALKALLGWAAQIQACRENLKGICVDATSLTLVTLDVHGKPLGLTRQEPLAQIQLWKRHTAQKQAQEALDLAQRMKEPFLERTGGSISSEWTLPKLLEMRDEDPQVYALADLAMDLPEYLTYRLTGIPTRSMGSMCYKALWAQDLGFPSDAYLDALRPGFSAEYKHLLRGEVTLPGCKTGMLSQAMKAAYGFAGDITVATGVLDGHCALVAMGTLHPGDAGLTLGTSSVLTLQSPALYPVPEVCGVAMDAQLPGLCAVDSGQSGTGDMLEWYMQFALPFSYAQEAQNRGISPHQLLAEKIREPWNNPVMAADWWNGSRNAPCNLALAGNLYGLTLQTRPEDIYLALLQGIVCGTRRILQVCRDAGFPVHSLRASGGLAMKSPLLMQQYANILHMPVLAAQEDEGPALGSAILAAVAAGIYPTPEAAHARMGIRRFRKYLPDTEHAQAYETLYRRNCSIREGIIQYHQKETMQ